MPSSVRRGPKPERGAAAGELPEHVGLMLEGGRTARIKALDAEGRPIAGTGFVLWLLKKDGRSSEVNAFSRSIVATTGPDGVATFDWLPVTKDLLQFWPTDDAYANRRVVVEEEQTQPVTTRLVRTEAIRGRVVHADGTPAAGIWLEAYGSGKKLDNGRGEALTRRRRVVRDDGQPGRGLRRLRRRQGLGRDVCASTSSSARASRPRASTSRSPAGLVIRGTVIGRRRQPARGRRVHPAR